MTDPTDEDDDEGPASGLLGEVNDGLREGKKNVRAVSEGGEPDLGNLERLVGAMIAIRDRKIWYGWVLPTEEDVKIAEHLVDLVRSGAPREALVEPARHVYRSIADPEALYSVGGLLLWLAGEPCEEEPRVEHRWAIMDRAVAFFERGGNVAGFVPGPEDVARIRRLRELLDEGDSEERRRLASEQWARYPRDNVTDGIRRITLRDDDRGVSGGG